MSINRTRDKNSIENSRLPAVWIVIWPSAILARGRVTSICDGLVPTDVNPCPVAHDISSLSRDQSTTRDQSKPSYSTKRICFGVHWPLGIRVERPSFAL